MDRPFSGVIVVLLVQVVVSVGGSNTFAGLYAIVCQSVFREHSE